MAGGKCDPRLAEATGVEFRAEVPFKGRPMVEIVRSAVEHLAEPVIVGGPTGLGPRQVDGGRTFIESVRKGLENVTTDVFFLTTVDLPCLTRDSVDGFLGDADPAAALNYPVIRADVCEKAFPGMKRTTLKVRDGEFTGGNVAMMRTDLMRKALPVLETAYANRKSPLKLAGQVGIGLLGRILVAKLAPWTLTLPDLERKVGQFLGVQVKAVQTPFAEIGADIDNFDQFQSLLSLKNT